MQHSNVENGAVYPLVMIRCGDNKVMRAFHSIYCLHPFCNERLLLSPGKTKLPVNAIQKFGHQKGWKLDKKGYALCPRHAYGTGKTSTLKPAQKKAAFLRIKSKAEAADAAKPKKLQPTTAPTIVITEKPMPGATTAPVKQITREDRRLIMDWLDLNYDPDNQRYIKDWDDEKASKTLARPRAWIAQIRDEFFGPDQNEASAKFDEATRELAVEANRIQEAALKLAAEAEALERRVRAHLKDKM